ncbi:MAG TPA: HEAT repeat domain-containing protein, partial [Dehalococcoidia bacterium]|nr:HEAT repeat domain-containing protein [Dehalococcoidia bacterium]
MSDLDTLFERLRSQRWEARKAAAQAMVAAGAPAVKYLSKALSDENPDLRLIAAKALGWMRSPAVVTPLVGALADEDAGVRKTAAEAVAK